MSCISSCVGKVIPTETELLRAEDALIRLFDPSRSMKDHKSREAIVFRFLLDDKQSASDRQCVEHLLHYKFTNSHRHHFITGRELESAFAKYHANQLEIQTETLALFKHYITSLSWSKYSNESEHYSRLTSSATTFRRKYRARLNRDQRYALDVAIRISQR
jgi:hypothetical protein